MCKYLICSYFLVENQVQNQDYILIFLSIELLFFDGLPMGWVRTSIMDVLVLFNSMAK